MNAPTLPTCEIVMTGLDPVIHELLFFNRLENQAWMPVPGTGMTEQRMCEAYPAAARASLPEHRR